MSDNRRRNEPISAEDVSSEQLKLMGEDVLVRAVPLEDVRQSGLWVQRKAQDFLGGCFYGTVVATGPGRLVERGPSEKEIASFVERAILGLNDHGPSIDVTSAVRVAVDVAAFVSERRRVERVPLQAKPGDRVAVRFGFGPEIRLRDGLHHVVGRGNSQHGHGILAAWETEHVHCWHAQEVFFPIRGGHGTIARCACGAEKTDADALTRLPSCTSCPPGARVAEAHRTDSLMNFPIAAGGGPGVYEHAPIEDRPGDAL